MHESICLTVGKLDGSPYLRARSSEFSVHRVVLRFSTRSRLDLPESLLQVPQVGHCDHVDQYYVVAVQCCLVALTTMVTDIFEKGLAPDTSSHVRIFVFKIGDSMRGPA